LLRHAFRQKILSRVIRKTVEGEDGQRRSPRDAIRALCPEKECEVDLALFTGLRWGEQYTLTWKHVDLARNQITLPSTKSGKKQYVPINGGARAALTKLRELACGSETVCPGTSYYNKHKRKFWQLVVEKAGITDVHWHDLRHTFASRLVMAGVDIFTVSKLLRHGQVSTTERYAHLSTAHLAAAVERLDAPSVTVGVQSRERRQYLQ
jgi:integrase